MVTYYNPNFYIISGGPGCGKTTLLNELQERGYLTVKEVARDIIKEQVNMGGSALPWEDKEEYTCLMVESSIQDFEKNIQNNVPTFFDRGIPDSYAYSILCDLKIKEKLKEVCEKWRYNPTVFILPPWKEIYCTDEERKQDFSTAIETYEVIKNTYIEIEYNVLEVPMENVKERAEYVLSHIN